MYSHTDYNIKLNFNGGNNEAVLSTLEKPTIEWKTKKNICPEK